MEISDYIRKIMLIRGYFHCSSFSKYMPGHIPKDFFCLLISFLCLLLSFETLKTISKYKGFIKFT